MPLCQPYGEREDVLQSEPLAPDLKYELSMNLNQPPFDSRALECAIRGCGLHCHTCAAERQARAAQLSKLGVESVRIRQPKIGMIEDVEETRT
jgi:hypothetical protein